MKIIVIGAGAMGCFFASQLALGGQKPLLYDIDQEKVARIAAAGIVVDGQTVPVSAAASLPQSDESTLYLVLVKAPQTAAAAQALAAVAGKRDLILTLQNGLGNVEQLEKYFAPAQLLAGVTYQGAAELALGQIAHTGSGMTVIAPCTPSEMAQAMEVAQLLNGCGIATFATHEIEAMRWKKLLVNSAINPLAALKGVKNGQLLSDPATAAEMEALVREGLAVAQALKVPLGFDEVWVAVQSTCKRTADNTASMLADVQAGRVTEIRAICGSIVEIGKKHDLAAPVCQRMVEAVEALSEERKH